MCSLLDISSLTLFSTRLLLGYDANSVFFSNSFLHSRFIQLYLLFLLCGQIHTMSQSSPTQAYTQAINDLDKELEYLKQAFEVCF
jgi:hypothetical protein